MKATINRFEGEFAVMIPSGSSQPFNLPKSAVPAGAGEGTTLELLHGSWVIDAADSEERRRRIAEKARRLFSE